MRRWPSRTVTVPCLFTHGGQRDQDPVQAEGFDQFGELGVLVGVGAYVVAYLQGGGVDVFKDSGRRGGALGIGGGHAGCPLSAVG